MANESRIGKAAEYLIASSVMLCTNGELNVSTALVDDEGVDLVFHRRNRAATLAVQVKTRTTDSATYLKKSRVLADVRPETFQPRPDLAILVALIDKPTASLVQTWLVPSEDFAAMRAGQKLRLTASTKESTKDQWSGYRHSLDELAGRIRELLEELERDAV